MKISKKIKNAYPFLWVLSMFAACAKPAEMESRAGGIFFISQADHTVSLFTLSDKSKQISLYEVNQLQPSNSRLVDIAFSDKVVFINGRTEILKYEDYNRSYQLIDLKNPEKIIMVPIQNDAFTKSAGYFDQELWMVSPQGQFMAFHPGTKQWTQNPQPLPHTNQETTISVVHSQKRKIIYTNGQTLWQAQVVDNSLRTDKLDEFNVPIKYIDLPGEGNDLLVGDEQGNIRLYTWDAPFNIYRLQNSLAQGPAAVVSVTNNPTIRYTTIIYANGTVQVYDLKKQRVLFSIQDDEIISAFSFEQEVWLLKKGQDSLDVWTLANGFTPAILEPEAKWARSKTDYIDSIDVNPQGNQILEVRHEGQIFVWTLQADHKWTAVLLTTDPKEQKTHAPIATYGKFFPKADRILTTGADHKVYVWKQTAPTIWSPTLLKITATDIATHANDITNDLVLAMVETNQNPMRLVTAPKTSASGSQLFVWEETTSNNWVATELPLKISATTYLHPSAINKVAFSPDGNQMVSIGVYGESYTWKKDAVGTWVATQITNRLESSSLYLSFGKVLLNNQGSRLIMSTTNGSIFVCTKGQSPPCKTLTKPQKGYRALDATTFAFQNEQLVSMDQGRLVHWDFSVEPSKEGGIFTKQPVSDNSFFGATFSQMGQQLLTVDTYNGITLWNLQNEPASGLRISSLAPGNVLNRKSALFLSQDQQIVTIDKDLTVWSRAQTPTKIQTKSLLGYPAPPPKMPVL